MAMPDDSTVDPHQPAAGAAEGRHQRRLVSAQWTDGGESLDLREARLLAGALDLQALLHPAGSMKVTVRRGDRGDLPTLSGEGTRAYPAKRGGHGLGLLDVQSLVPGDGTLAAPIDLVLDLGGGVRLEATRNDVSMPGLRRALRLRAPVAVDALFQLDTDRIERVLARRDPSVAQTVDLGPVPAVTAVGPPAVLFGMYFLEHGGAEKWALACVAAARSAGLVPIVLTDHASPHPLVGHPAMRDAVFLPLTHGLSPAEDALLLRSLRAVYDVRLIHLHHSQWLYDRLPWLRRAWPEVPVIDSLHILEWRGGGFVETALRVRDAVDIHHVISPALEAHLRGRGVPESKIVMRPLLDLEPVANTVEPQAEKKAVAGSQLVVGFVGRLTQQKRPFLFLALARWLLRSAPGRFRFILQGDGELEDQTAAQLGRRGLASVVERRYSYEPVVRTYADCDVIVLPSDNEGLALVTFEAVRAGCLVLSTDVGSQSSVVIGEALLPRHPFAFLWSAQRVLKSLASDRGRLQALRVQQVARVERLAQLEGARTWVAQIYGERAERATSGST